MSEKPVIQYDKIFNVSMKLTGTYIVGLAVFSKLFELPVQWIDILEEGFDLFIVLYILGASVNFIYNHIQNAKAKRAKDYKNNQNIR